MKMIFTGSSTRNTFGGGLEAPGSKFCIQQMALSFGLSDNRLVSRR